MGGYIERLAQERARFARKRGPGTFLDQKGEWPTAGPIPAKSHGAATAGQRFVRDRTLLCLLGC